MLLWSTIGSVVGALILYGLGALVGADRSARLAERLPLMSADEVQRSWQAVDRWDRKAVFFGRLVPGVRSFISIPAGARRMPLLLFVVLTSAGSFIWNLVLIGTGYVLGERWSDTAAISHWANIGVLAIGLAGVAWWIKGRITRPSVTS